MNTPKNCIDCSGVLTLGGNWTEARESQSKYLCKTCWAKRDKLGMFVNGKYISTKHPFHKSGRYKTFEGAAFASLNNYADIKEGYVYVISNPAWEGWYKVGMALDASDRCSGYQTSSPFRDYTIRYSKYFEDRREAERLVHNILKKNHTEHMNEWFKTDLDTLKTTIKNIEGTQHEA